MSAMLAHFDPTIHSPVVSVLPSKQNQRPMVLSSQLAGRSAHRMSTSQALHPWAHLWDYTETISSQEHVYREHAQEGSCPATTYTWTCQHQQQYVTCAMDRARSYLIRGGDVRPRGGAHRLIQRYRFVETYPLPQPPDSSPRSPTDI